MEEYKIQNPIIRERNKIVIACDVPFEEFFTLVRETRAIPEVGGYKIPARAGRMGWEKWNRILKSYTDKIPIYDHQKGGTDVPDTQRGFMEDVKASGFSAVILYPRLDDEPKVHEFHIREAMDAGLKVMIGGKMTHQQFNSEQYEKAFKIYETAYRIGVRNFGLPTNSLPDLEFSENIKRIFWQEKIDFFPIGIGPQGGNLDEITKIFAGTRFHPIIGRLIYEASNIKQATLDLASKLN